VKKLNARKGSTKYQPISERREAFSEKKNQGRITRSRLANGALGNHERGRLLREIGIGRVSPEQECFTQTVIT